LILTLEEALAFSLSVYQGCSGDLMLRVSVQNAVQTLRHSSAQVWTRSRIKKPSEKMQMVCSTPKAMKLEERRWVFWSLRIYEGLLGISIGQLSLDISVRGIWVRGTLEEKKVSVSAYKAA